MKTTRLVAALAVVVGLFIWSIREKFEDTAQVHGPPYGNTASEARKIINIMSPTMLSSIKKQAGVKSETLTDVDAVTIVYGNATNSSPIAQVMSDFYWQVYKSATSTISLAQVNNFMKTRTDTWVLANISDTRDFLSRYFIQGQNGAAQSGYLDALNTVWGQAEIKSANTHAPVSAPTTEPAPVSNTVTIVSYVAIGISAVAILAVVVTLLLPPRNVL